MSASIMPVALHAGSLDQFIQTVNQAPYLSAEEERSLALRLRDDNDLEAARQLVFSHLRYVVHVARGYKGYGLPLADLIQEGAIGLMKAVKRFDPERGVRLVSFAMHWIKAEIHEYVIRNWHLLKVATTKAQRKLFFNLRGKKARLGRVGADEAGEIAEDLGVSPDDVLEMDARLGERPVSLSADNDDDDGEPRRPALQLAAPATDQPELLTEAQEWQTYQSDRLQAALRTLDERSREIIKARWLGEQKSGLKELGELHGVSAERIRQIEAQALRKLSSALAT